MKTNHLEELIHFQNYLQPTPTNNTKTIYGTIMSLQYSIPRFITFRKVAIIPQAFIMKTKINDRLTLNVDGGYVHNCTNGTQTIVKTQANNSTTLIPDTKTYQIWAR